MFFYLLTSDCARPRHLAQYHSLPGSLHSSPAGRVIISALQVKMMDSGPRQAKYICLSPLRASGTPSSAGCLRSGGHRLCTACFILRLPASVSTQTPRMWAARVQDLQSDEWYRQALNSKACQCLQTAPSIAGCVHLGPQYKSLTFACLAIYPEACWGSCPLSLETVRLRFSVHQDKGKRNGFSFF